MRNLKFNEIENVSGGIIPIIVAVIAVTSVLTAEEKSQDSESGHNG